MTECGGGGSAHVRTLARACEKRIPLQFPPGGRFFSCVRRRPSRVGREGWRCQPKKNSSKYIPPTKKLCRRTDKNAMQAVQAYRVWRRVPLPENACRRPRCSNRPPATKGGGRPVWPTSHLAMNWAQVGRCGYQSLGPRHVRPSFVNFDRAPGP